MNWPISWNDVKNHIDDMEDGIPPELLPQGGVGYSEPGMVFTYDGGEDGEFADISDTRFVKLSDDVFDLSKIEKIKCVLANNGQTLEFTKEDFEITSGDGVSVIGLSYSNTTLPAIFAGNDGGLYGFAQTDMGYLSYVEFSETIHHIEPKYLPGLEIDLADYGVDVFALFAQGGGTATIQDQVKFAELVYYNRDVPITFVIKNSAAEIEVKAEASKTSSGGYINGLTATIPLYYGSKYYVAYLWVSGHSVVKLSVTAVN